MITTCCLTNRWSQSAIKPASGSAFRCNKIKDHDKGMKKADNSKKYDIIEKTKTN